MVSSCHTATTKLWYKIMLIASAVVTAISLILWLALIEYTVSNGEYMYVCGYVSISIL